ncbi:MAG: DinB family protein [Acidobacteria bacterium]|nr:DinB family protein [Acidobacteriota bacterium]
MNQRYFLSVLTSLLVLVSLLVVAGAPLRAGSLTKAERERLVNHLQKTRQFLLDEVAGLSEAQANFKPAEDRWSIAECAEHITLSEVFLRGAVGQAMQAPATPERKEELKGKEDQVLQFVTDRSQKFQAPEPLRPTGRWDSLEATIEVFKASRKKTLDYAHSTPEDLRSHIVAFPTGDMDAYQFLLFLSGGSMVRMPRAGPIAMAAAKKNKTRRGERLLMEKGL